jgi:hypothetical protein
VIIPFSSRDPVRSFYKKRKFNFFVSKKSGKTIHVQVCMVKFASKNLFRCGVHKKDKCWKKNRAIFRLGNITYYSEKLCWFIKNMCMYPRKCLKLWNIIVNFFDVVFTGIPEHKLCTLWICNYYTIIKQDIHMDIYSISNLHYK